MKKLFVMIMALVALFVNGADARIEAIQNLPKGVHATTRNCEDCCGSGHKLVVQKRKSHMKRKTYTIGTVKENIPCQKCRGTGKRLRYDNEYWEEMKKGYSLHIDPNGITNKK